MGRCRRARRARKPSRPDRTPSSHLKVKCRAPEYLLVPFPYERPPATSLDAGDCPDLQRGHRGSNRDLRDSSEVRRASLPGSTVSIRPWSSSETTKWWVTPRLRPIAPGTGMRESRSSACTLREGTEGPALGQRRWRRSCARPRMRASGSSSLGSSLRTSPAADSWRGSASERSASTAGTPDSMVSGGTS